MELKLNVYKTQKEIEKTYEIDTYDLMTGTTEDLLNIIEIDNLSGKNDRELTIEIAKLVVKHFDMLYQLIHDMFGITQEEYKRTKVKELAQVIFKFVVHTMGEFGKLNTKN